MATLKPARILPQARPLGTRVAINTVAFGRPSANLGHVLNAQINKLPDLFPHIGESNPIPFTVFRPEVNHAAATEHYGNRVMTAVKAIARPRNAIGGNPTLVSVGIGHRISTAIRLLTRG
jgi:hypothetical protein